MRQNAFIRRLLAPFQQTPFHPQWFVYRDERESLLAIGRQARGLTFDIGAGAQQVRNYLPSGCRYLSLDYYQTAAEWYHTRPQLFGDGQRLPIKANSVDTVLLLDVLEHLPRPENCIAEIRRVLRPGGDWCCKCPFCIRSTMRHMIFIAGQFMGYAPWPNATNLTSKARWYVGIRPKAPPY
ncbi:MAG: class I SAM-dependent methyltransferase [Chloroflexi bacterium]|nr:class I SAM-dependent methyltransferase [Chloroflexota bacterium]